MVTPECPPITGTFTVVTSRPLASATKVLALTISNVLTPNILQKTKNQCTCSNRNCIH